LGVNLGGESWGLGQSPKYLMNFTLTHVSGIDGATTVSVFNVQLNKIAK
jgi:hypothetical protein